MKNKYLLGFAAIMMLVAASCNIRADSGEKSTARPIHCLNQGEGLYIKPNGMVTDPIVKLLGLTGIRISQNKPEKGWPEGRILLHTQTLADVVAAVQGKANPLITWLGDPTKERWENDSTKIGLSPSNAKAILAICEGDLNLKQKMVPQGSNPIGILFLGATLSRVRTRLAFLNELYQTKKLSPTLPVYQLTGERELDEKAGETYQNLNDSSNGLIAFRDDWTSSIASVRDEGEMVKLIFQQSRHKSLSESNIHYVYSPKGDMRRATTESTVVQWLKDFSPASGKYIAISNQPYNIYQEAVIRRVLIKAGRSDICVEVVGPGMDDIKPEIGEGTIVRAKNLLNTISRTLYEFLEMNQKSSAHVAKS